MMTALALVPIMGGLAVAVDYTEMSRQRQATLNALDAAGIATARRSIEGATETELVAYAKEFFEANLGGIDPSLVSLDVVLPTDNVGGGTLKLSAKSKYEPLFLGAFLSLLGRETVNANLLSFDAATEIRLKNTLEVALVLDNSGSMDFIGTGTGKKRLVLLKEAAKQLVETIAAQASQMKQVDQPVRFALVPFAASVNVGPQHATASWMDTEGRSPVHHENFDWSTMSTSLRVSLSGGVWRKTGTGWGAQQNQIATRFTLYDDLQRVTGRETVQTGTTTEQQCTGSGRNRVCRDVVVPVYTERDVLGRYTNWAGCVETRPGNLAYDNTPPTISNPASLFVPMFAPDETDRRDSWNRAAMGNWWRDRITTDNDTARQRDMRKYFEPAPQEGSPLRPKAMAGAYEGPNQMCSTTPITPLTDVTTQAGLNTVKNAIDAMQALGATDVPEGTAWGWRVLSSKEPFTQGRPDHETGNDKVLIVLTDGENTYYTPNSLGYNDLAGNKSIYSNSGYTNQNYNNGSTTRLFMNTSVNKSDFSNTNYNRAMNQHMDTVCENAKAAGIIVMTVALDLSMSVAVEKAAIEALTRCASDSRFRKDPSNPARPAKLFWNANGANLAEKFKEIADELSNLRIVG